MLCLQYAISYVRANKMIGKTTLYTGGRKKVFHQCELLNVSAIVQNLQRFCVEGAGKHCTAAQVSNSAWLPCLASAQEIEEQESNGADFSQSSCRSLPALQQACPSITRDEYFINTIDRKLQNKQKECQKRAPKNSSIKCRSLLLLETCPVMTPQVLLVDYVDLPSCFPLQLDMS
jgi:hypothetical protein